MKKIYKYFENNYNYDFYCTVNYEIKKVRRKNKINHEELKKIYDEVNREEKKTRKRKIDNNDKPRRRRAAPKPKPKQQQQQQQQQSEPKQDDIPIIYYI